MKAVLSMGNPLKGDDDIGNIIVSQLEKMEGFSYFITETLPSNFISPLEKINPSSIYFVDAVEFDGSPGDVKLFGSSEIETLNSSTHSLPVSLFSKFFPKAELFVIGIKPKEVDFGQMSDELRGMVPEIKKRVESVLFSGD
jgi:hydrogenase 3 maturation protease